MVSARTPTRSLPLGGRARPLRRGRAAAALRTDHFLLVLLTLAIGACRRGETDGADETGADSTSTSETDSGDSTDGMESGSTTDFPSPDLPSDDLLWELRVLTWNFEGLGSPASDEFAAVDKILARLDADVACVQELWPSQRDELDVLAGQLDYPDWFAADDSPELGGDILNACMSRWSLAAAESHSASDLSRDPAANDIGRDIVEIRLLNPDSTWPREVGVGVFTVHLKAGQTATDRFRRQVELIRLSNAVTTYRAAHPQDATIVLGDFNHVVQDAANGREQFSMPPPDLPAQYVLGNDIEFPVLTDPFGLLVDLDFRLLHPGHEDTTFDATHRPTTRRIDFIAIADSDDASVVISTIESEIYDACKDDGVDADPPGGRLDKVGRPLACETSADASDHWPVAADLRLTIADP